MYFSTTSQKMPELDDNLTPFSPSYYNNLHSASYVRTCVLNTVLIGTMTAHPSLLIYWPNPGTGGGGSASTVFALKA